MTITVAIPTLNRPGDMAEFMPTLRAQTVLPDQFIVVDAGDPSTLADQMDEVLGDTGMELLYLRSASPLRAVHPLDVFKAHSSTLREPLMAGSPKSIAHSD